MKSALKTWGPVALAMLLVILVFGTGVLDRQVTWTNIAEWMLTFTEGSQRTVEGAGYGEMNSGPGLTLPAGEYRLKWIIDGDGENRVLLRTDNHADISVESIAVGPDNAQGEISFELYEMAEKFEIIVSFEDGTWIDVYDFRLYSPFYRDHAFTFAFAALIFCVVWLRRKGWSAEDRGIYLLLATAVVFASAPSFRDALIDVYDTQFHAIRIYNLADGLRSGQFPVRVGGYAYEGYGAATPVFYPDIFLYPSALMLLAGASIQYVMNLYFVVINALAAAAMYVCAKRIFGDRWMAACASILYTLALYRITNCYVRCALGEATAMSLLPLFLLGLWEVVFGDRRRWPVLAGGATAIFLCHLITTLLCAVFSAAVCVLFLPRLVRERRMTAIFKAIAVTVLLCMFQLVPFAMFSAQGIGAAPIMLSVEKYALAPAQLFIWGRGNMGYGPSDNSINWQAIEPGLPLLLGAVLTVYILMTRGWRRKDGQQGFAVIAVICGCAAALMTTTLFPWKHVELLTQDYSSFLQYAWRMMLLVCLFFSLAGGFGFIRLAGEKSELMTVGVLALSILFALPTLDKQVRLEELIRYGETFSSRQVNAEYQIPGTDVLLTDDRDPLPSQGLSLEQYVKRGTRVSAQVEAYEDSTLTLPLFGFDGYAAEVDGERMEVALGGNNRLTVLLPAGTSGTLRVWYEGKAIWRVSDAVSLLTLLACMAFWGARGWRLKKAR